MSEDVPALFNSFKLFSSFRLLSQFNHKAGSFKNRMAMVALTLTLMATLTLTLAWAFWVGVMLNLELTVSQMLLQVRNNSQQAYKAQNTYQDELEHNSGAVLTILS